MFDCRVFITTILLCFVLRQHDFSLATKITIYISTIAMLGLLLRIDNPPGVVFVMDVFNIASMVLTVIWVVVRIMIRYRDNEDTIYITRRRFSSPAIKSPAGVDPHSVSVVLTCVLTYGCDNADTFSGISGVNWLTLEASRALRKHPVIRTVIEQGYAQTYKYIGLLKTGDCFYKRTCSWVHGYYKHGRYQQLTYAFINGENQWSLGLRIDTMTNVIYSGFEITMPITEENPEKIMRTLESTRCSQYTKRQCIGLIEEYMNVEITSSDIFVRRFYDYGLHIEDVSGIDEHFQEFISESQEIFNQYQ